MAEVYGIFDLEALPARVLAALAVGLPDGCRIKRAFSGAKADNTQLLLALIADELGQLVWMQTKDARHGRNRPESLLETLTEPRKKAPGKGAADLVTFEGGDAFLTARAIAIMQGGGG